MNRWRADAVAGLAVAVVLVVGAALTWQASQQQRAFGQMGSMMGSPMGATHGTNPLWYVLGTLLVAGVVAGGYVVAREDLTATDASDRTPDQQPTAVGEGVPDAPAAEPDPESDPSSVDSPDAVAPEEQPRARVLDLLPDDERRILEPVLSSPGITQIELRDRSAFSKSKVSQTVSALEERGLLYRERQGRTYRIFPSDELRESRE